MPFAKVNFGLIAYCVGSVLRSQIALRFTEDLKFLHRVHLRQEHTIWATLATSETRSISGTHSLSLVKGKFPRQRINRWSYRRPTRSWSWRRTVGLTLFDLNGQNPGRAEDVVQPRLRSRKSPLPE
jgi:hypothetical protein